MVQMVTLRFTDEIFSRRPYHRKSIKHILYQKPTTPEENEPFSHFTDIKLDAYQKNW